MMMPEVPEVTAIAVDHRGSIRGRSLAEFRDRGDCGGCRIEDCGVGVVEGIEKTFRSLRNRLHGLRLRSWIKEIGYHEIL